MEKILIIKLSALGDFIIAVGVMQKIREKHPNAEFTLMTGSPYIPIAKQMNMFSNIIVDNRGTWWNIPRLIKLAKEVAKGDFDHVYDIQGVSRTKKKYFSALRLLARKPFVWYNVHECTEWHVEKKGSMGFGKLTEKQGISHAQVTDLYFLHGPNKHFHLLPERYVLLIPGCSAKNAHKRWPVESYCEIVRRLAERGIHSVVIGTNAEAAEINAICESNPMAINMLNKTALLDVPDLARRSYVTLGNDTGPTHMASLSSVPTVAVYWSKTRYGQLKGPRSVSIVSPGSIEQIPVDQVWEHILPHLPA
ncbi:MAG: glycosyltransferase family 9 protein [Akkermansia sp.]|nr:glycosyltransferase family 9 protein [Akkermansia sp.]